MADAAGGGAALRAARAAAAVAVSTAERLHRVGATAASPSELDRLLHPLVVDAVRLRLAGWQPAWNSAGALDAYLSGHRTAPLPAAPAPTARPARRLPCSARRPWSAARGSAAAAERRTCAPRRTVPA